MVQNMVQIVITFWFVLIIIYKNARSCLFDLRMDNLFKMSYNMIKESVLSKWANT